MAENMKELIDWESIFGNRTGAIPKRPLVVQLQDDHISLNSSASEVFTPVQHSRGMPNPQATSTMLPKQPVSHFDESDEEYGEAEPELTKSKPIEETLQTLANYRRYYDMLKRREWQKMKADYAAGKQFRSQEDQALAAEFPDMSPRKRRTAKREFRSPQPHLDRTSALRQYRSNLLEVLAQRDMDKPLLYKHHYGQSPPKPKPLENRERFMARMRDPELEELMKKYRSTDEKQKERSERILSHISKRNLDEREFHNEFMENVFSPPATERHSLRRNIKAPPLSQQVWMERGNVPDTMSAQRESIRRRMTQAKAYLKKLRGERLTRFKTVEERRKRHYDRDPAEDYFLSDDEPDTFTEQIEIQEKGVPLDGSPREVVNLVIPEEAVLNLSMISEQSPEIVAPEAILTSQMDAKQNRAGEGQESPADIHLEDVEEEIIQEFSENFDQIYENAKATQAADDDHVSVDLEVRAPETSNFCHMRGSEMPSWFPGFHVAVPGDGSKIRCERSPSAAMLLAWRKMQPGLLNVF